MCQQIRSGAIGRRNAQKKYSLSANLVQLWLTQYDRGELDSEEAEASVLADYEAKIAALERKVGQLTMELDLLTKNAAPAPREQRRQLFDHQRPDGCSIRRGCQVIDLPRSTFYYRQSLPQSTVSDLRLVELIGSIQDELPGYRYRRVTAELRRRGMVINHERISRVMKAHRGARGRSPRRQPPGRG